MKRHIAGFSLIELMIAVAIVGILAAIAYPSYRNYVLKAGRADGQGMLMDAMARQERFYTENNTYTTSLTSLGYSADTNVASPEGNYQLSAAACGAGITSCVKLTATPAGGQAEDTECANLTLDSTGAKGISGTGTAAACW